MAKPGFKGQWIEIARVGRVRDSKGVMRDLGKKLLEDAVANFNASGMEAPLTIGHPKAGDPAHGWIEELRMRGDVVEMKAQDTSDYLEQAVRDGRYRTRSGGLWLSHHSLKAPIFDHVAFLGAEAPAVKGLKPIQLSESADGESLFVETQEPIHFTEETPMEEKDLDQLPQSFWDKFKSKLGITDKRTELNEGGNPVPQPAVITADEIKQIAETAASAVRTELSEKIQTLETENKDLRSRVDGQIAGSERSEIAQFVEGIPAEKGKHLLKRIGIVEFMGALASADKADGEDLAVCFSEGEGDKREEHKFSRVEWFKNFIGALPKRVELGEKFGGITASAVTAEEPVRAEVQERIKKTLATTKVDNGGER